jgi:hypothetical protein
MLLKRYQHLDVNERRRVAERAKTEIAAKKHKRHKK